MHCQKEALTDWFRANVEQDGAFHVVSRIAYEFAVAAKEAKLYGDLR